MLKQFLKCILGYFCIDYDVNHAILQPSFSILPTQALGFFVVDGLRHFRLPESWLKGSPSGGLRQNFKIPVDVDSELILQKSP